VPLGELSVYFAVAGALLTAVLAIVMFWFSDELVGSAALRGVLAASFVLHPLVGYELLNSATNVIWPLTVVAFVALLRRPRAMTDMLVAATIVFLAVASQVLCVLWLPVAGLAVWRRPRDRRTRIVVGSFVVGILVQGIAVFVGTSESTRGASHAIDLVKLFVARVMGTAALGERWVGDAWSASGWAILAPIAALVVAAIVILEVRASWPVRFDSCVCFAAAIGFFAVSVGFRGSDSIALTSGSWQQGMSRFVFVSLVLLLLGVFTLIDRADMSDVLRTVVTALVVVQFVVIAIGAFSYTNPRSAGPVWGVNVGAARVACKGQPSDHAVSIGIAPAGTWSVPLDCAEVRARS